MKNDHQTDTTVTTDTAATDTAAARCPSPEYGITSNGLPYTKVGSTVFLKSANAALTQRMSGYDAARVRRSGN